MNSIRTQISHLENLDFDRRLNNLRKWMKKYGVSKAGDKCKYRNIEWMVNMIVGMYPATFIILLPMHISNNNGAPKEITFK